MRSSLHIVFTSSLPQWRQQFLGRTVVILGTLVNVMMDLKILLFLIHGMAQDWIAVSIVIACMKHCACVQ
jgi:hypothetical protein